MRKEIRRLKRHLTEVAASDLRDLKQRVAALEKKVEALEDVVLVVKK